MNRPFNEREVSILHFDDSEADLRLIAARLNAAWPKIRLTQARSRAEYDNAWRAQEPDIILMDANVPGVDIEEVITVTNARYPAVPILIVTGSIGEENAVRLIKSGATDFLSKDQIQRLPEKVIQSYALRRARSAAVEQEAKYHAIFENASDGILLISPGGQVLEANRRARDCFDSGSLVGMSIVDLVHEEERSTLAEKMKGLAVGDRRISTYRIMRPDRSETVVESNSVRLPNGAVLSVIRDISASSRTAARLAQQELVLEQASDGISVRGVDDVIVDWNRRAELIYGWSAEEAKGRRYVECIGADPKRYKSLIEELMLNGSVRTELEAAHKSGRKLCIDHRCTLIKSPSEQEPRSILAIDTDVTAEKEKERLALRMERLESIGTLAAGIAHDLNNIIAPIGMAVSLMKNMPMPVEAGTLMDAVEKSADRAAKLVRQILAFSKGVEGERSLVRLYDVVNAVHTFIEHTFPRSISIEVSVPRTLPLVRADATQLEQVVLNLAVNARDAMPGGGRLVIQADSVVLDQQYAKMVGNLKGGEYIVLRVTDAGTGIPADMMEKIFDPFFTTKERGHGTGLGLPTCESIVRSHQGRINVTSQVGVGTTFEVYIPTTEEAGKTANDVIARQSPPKGNGELIVVADDESSVLAVTQQTLERNNYRVITATNGAEAVAHFALRAAEVAVVITDIDMPIMNGLAVTAALRKIKQSVYVIAMTGLSSREQEQRAREAGIQVLMQKPFSADSLLRQVHEAFSK